MISPHLERGRILLSQSRYEQAEAEFRRLLADDPDNPLGHVLLAESLIGRNEGIEATEEAQRAIASDPDYDAAYATLARALSNRNRHDDALQAVNRAIALAPSDADYRTIKAAILMSLRKREEALVEVDTALAIDPEHAFAINLRPSVLQALGRLKEAEQATQESMRQRADDAHSHLARGWVLLEQGKAKEARSHFRDALRLDPQSEAARAGLVESIKGTNLLYRGFLAYAFRMSRLSPQVSFGLIFGLYFLFRTLSKLAADNPAMAPWVYPILALYFVFVVTTWIAVPLSNLLLRLHPDGKLALSAEQRRGSDLLVLCFGAVVGCVVWGFATGDAQWIVRGVYFFILALPVSAIMSTPEGWPRQTLIVICCCLAWLIIIGVVSPELEQRISPILPMLLLGSQFAASALASAQPRDRASE